MGRDTRRLEIFRTNYARSADWWVEHEGRRVARLTEGSWVDMFWWEYRIDLADFDDEARRIASDRALWTRGKLRFVSVPFELRAENAYCGGSGPADGSVAMRGLCIDIGPPTLWERFTLWRSP